MASTRTSRGLRLNVTELKAFFEANRQASAKRRTAYLKAHPDYIECLVAGCDGLVSPRFVRTAPDGQPYGLCPRRARHAQVAGEAFAH
jgi:hypothetical protein